MPPRANYPIVLAALVLAGSAFATHAQEKVPPRLAEDVVLSTKTPLGEASITLPADAEVKDFVEEGDEVVVRQGPFAATIPRTLLNFGAVVAATPEAPAPPVESAPAAVATTPEPVPSPSPTETASAAPWDNVLAEWQTFLPLAAAVVLGAYALFATLMLWRLRRRVAEKPSAPRPALPAVVTGDGNSIACPLCSKDIAVERLKSGRNRCPVCQGFFEVEKP